MKRLVLGAFTSLVCLAVAAEGYQVNTLSARQLGMGHVGAGMHLGAESMFFNPAGLGFMNDKLDVSGSFTAVFPTAKCTFPEMDGAGTDSPYRKAYKTANDPSTPIMFNAGFSVYDRLKAGISFYTPYGSGINWTDNWPGSVLSQSVTLKVFTIQPTLSWKITDKLSVGAGLTVNWGSVNLNKGLVVPETADYMLAVLAQAGKISQFQPYGTVMPASINLNGKSSVSCGFNVGVMYDIFDNLTVGVSYRSKVKMSVDAGEATISFADAQAQLILNELNVLNATNFAASMPCPYVLSMGVSWKPVPSLTLAADARLSGWKTYKSLDIEFLDERCAAYNQHIEKNYRNCWAISLGAEYAATNRLDVRAGLMIDTSPCNESHYNPETPGMTKIEPSAGFSFKPFAGFAVDFGFMYIAGLGVDGASCSYPDLLAVKLNALLPPAAHVQTTKTFTANYKVHAFIPSIGVRYAF